MNTQIIQNIFRSYKCLGDLHYLVRACFSWEDFWGLAGGMILAV